MPKVHCKERYLDDYYHQIIEFRRVASVLK